MESTPVGQLMGQIYDLKQLVENLRNQMGQLCEVQNELQKVVVSMSHVYEASLSAYSYYLVLNVGK